MGDTIHISGVQGDNVVIGKVVGSGNVIGKGNTVSGTITIHPEKTDSLPSELQLALQGFLEQINQQIKKANVKPEEVKPAQEAVEKFAEEANQHFEEATEAAKPTTNAAPTEAPKLSYTKKASLKDRLIKMASGLMKILPKTAETIASFTPLAPFGKLIGEGVGEIVKSVSEEG